VEKLNFLLVEDEQNVLAVRGRASTLDGTATILDIDASTLWRKHGRRDEGG
jgi:hypothetical protein